MPDHNLALARERLGHVLKERWVLESVVGVGGMAAVYAARHRNGARAAIKVLHGPLSEDQVVRERFLREAYLANSLEHPGTVHVLDDDFDAKLGPYLIMELLDGSSILELLDNGVTFDVPAALDIADQALDVLAAAHDRGIVHRDLKPANLFLCRNGQLKVLDFGIARVLDASQSRLTRTGVPLGTPAYMAPEQARGLGRDADGRSDLYALGATLFRILAGRHVHVGKGAEQIAAVATQRAPKLRSVTPELPAAVCDVIDRSLEFEPDRRYANAREMQTDVRAVQRGAVPPIASVPLPPAGPVPALPPLGPRRRRSTTQPNPATSEEPQADAVAELAETLRNRQREMARRPDAFTVAPTSADDEQEEDENMPTLVGSPQDMQIGAKPTTLADALAPKRQAPVIPPRRPKTEDQGFRGLAAAQAFARIPNVPVPSRPVFAAEPIPSAASTQPGGMLAVPTTAPATERRIDMRSSEDVDLDAPTLARGDKPASLNDVIAQHRGAIAASPPNRTSHGPSPVIQYAPEAMPEMPAPPSIPPAPPAVRVHVPAPPDPLAETSVSPDRAPRRGLLLVALALLIAAAVAAGIMFAKLP